MISSTSTVLAPEGQASYVAANSVLDALAGDRKSLRVRTLNYGIWRERGAVAVHRARLGIEPGEPVSHPVLSERSTDRDGNIHVIGKLTTAHHWLVDEHRTTDGVAVLPGTGHLELYLAAAQLAGADGPLGSVTLFEPLVVPEGASVTVRVTLSPPREDGGRSARLESDGGLASWRVHSEAEVLPALVNTSATAPVPKRSDGDVDVDVLTRPGALMRFGPRWHTVVAAWSDGEEVAGWLGLADEHREEVDAWSAHPALVDVATTFGMVLGTHEDRLYVPLGYDRVTSRGALPAAPWVRARRSGEPSKDVLRLDLELGDGEGNVLLTIEGLTLLPVSGSEILSRPSERREARRSGAPPSATPDHRREVTASSPTKALSCSSGSWRVATTVSSHPASSSTT